MVDKIKTGSAPVANAQKRTITKQTTSGVQTSSKSIAGNSYANAHRTTVQSGTLRSSMPIQQGYVGASKTINVGYVDTSAKSQMQANNQPSQQVNTAISSSISAPTQTQHTFDNANSHIHTGSTSESPRLQTQSQSQSMSHGMSQPQIMGVKSPVTSPTMPHQNVQPSRVEPQIQTATRGMSAPTQPQHTFTNTNSHMHTSSTSESPRLQTQSTTSTVHTQSVGAKSPIPTPTMVSSSVNSNTAEQLSQEPTSSMAQTIQTARPTSTVFGSVTNTTTQIRNAFSSYENRKVSSNVFSSLPQTLKVGGREIMSGVQGGISMSGDDLGTQSVNASIEGAKLGVTVFKGAQTATDVGIKAVPITAKAVRGTAVAGVQVAKQVGLSAVTVAQSFNIIKTMNIAPVSKQAMYLMKATAISSGLANTQISQGIARATQSVVNGAIKLGNGVATVGKGIATGARGVYSVGTTVGLATVTIAKAYNISRATNTFPVSVQGMKILRQSAIQTGLNNTMVSKAIVNGVKNAQAGIVHAYKTVSGTICTGINNIKAMTKTGIQTVKDTKNLVVATIRGIKKGTVSIGYVSYQLQKFAYLKAGKGINTLWKSVRGTAKIGWRGAKFAYPRIKTVAKGSMKIGKGVKGGVLTGASLLKGVSDDMAIQGVATALQMGDVAGRLSVSTLKTSFKIGKGIGKTGIKTARTLEKIGMTFWESYYRANSIRKAIFSVWNKGGAKLGHMLKQAGGSIVNMLINLAKGAMKKAIIPIIIIIIVAVAGTSIITVPASTVGFIFSGIFGTKDDSNPDIEEEQDVEAWIATNIVPYSDATKQDLVNDMQADYKANGGSYDIVRLKEVGGGSGVVSPTLDGVNQIFYTNAEIVNMLEAIYNCRVLMDYELSTTETQAKNLLKDLYDKIFRIETSDTSTSLEYCGQNLADGSGVANTAHCGGNIHALSDCPNKVTGTHTSFTCSDCDYYRYVCGGYEVLTCTDNEHTHTCKKCCSKKGWHLICNTDKCDDNEHTHGSGCYTTMYCNSGNEMETACSHSPTSIFHCNGYSYCGGHNVKTYSFSLDGLYPILNETFYQPIDTLEALGSSRTQEQEEQLQNLKEYLEIYENMAQEVFNGICGGGITMGDLSGITFVNGSRTPNQAVVDLALSQVGQQGGQPYWSYNGFSSRVSWCACFVNWCMRNTPSATNSYPNSSNNAYCQTVADNLNSLGQFGHDSSLIVAGDVIFFDWESDGHTDHIGIVIGRDNEKVYTVEGNSGDQVKVKSYNLGSSVIYGYGYLNY